MSQQLIATISLFILAFSQTPALPAADGGNPDKVSFYFAAHEDDWQLFMNPSAFRGRRSTVRRKTVFVHVTAGDAGLGIGSGGRKHPFYLARENGAETAIRFMADADDIPAERIAGPMSFNGHSIYRVSYRNTVSYFLRVPDGSPQGTGYYGTGFQSLKRLADGDNNILSAIDGSTIYHGWSDLVATVRKIVDFERGRAGTVQLNVAELDARINPGDHSDHLMTAQGRARCRPGPRLRAARLLRGLCQLTAAGKSRCTAARHGKLGVCRHTRRRAGLRSPHLLAPLR